MSINILEEPCVPIFRIGFSLPWTCRLYHGRPDLGTYHGENLIYHAAYL